MGVSEIDLGTIEGILQWFKEACEEKQAITVTQWLNAGLRLNVLAQELDEKEAEYKFLMDVKEMELIEEGKPASKAKILKRTALSGDEYKQYLKIQAQKERILEFIRLAKRYGEVEQYKKYV